MNQEPLVLTERRGTVALLTLNRPPVNALNRALLDGILHAVEACARDHSVRAVVLSGGRRAFSAGADIRELEPLSDAAAREWIGHGQRVLNEIGQINRPVVAAIEGFCLGGGLRAEPGLPHAHGRWGAELGLPEIKLGIIPGFGGTQRLPRLVGSGAALELMLTGDPYGADQALAIGLVNRVVDSGRASRRRSSWPRRSRTARRRPRPRSCASTTAGSTTTSGRTRPRARRGRGRRPLVGRPGGAEGLRREAPAGLRGAAALVFLG